MSELKRKDQEFESDNKQLSTADLAGRGERRRDPEQRMQPQSVAASGSRPDLQDERLRREGSPSSEPGEHPLATARPTDFDSPAVPADGQPAPLFSESEVGGFHSRWSEIQLAFVDEPRQAVEDADNLVASVMKKLAEGFATERAGLEGQWDRGDSVSTEDLRVALQRYRSFFDRLLKV